MKNLNDINLETPEGKLLMAAISVITTESRRTSHPDEVLQHIVWLSEYIYRPAIFNRAEHESRRVLPVHKRLSEAVQELALSLNEDPEFAFGWRSNIAMSMVDVWKSKHELTNDYKNENIISIANEAATTFIDRLISDALKEVPVKHMIKQDDGSFREQTADDIVIQMPTCPASNCYDELPKVNYSKCEKGHSPFLGDINPNTL